MGSDFFAADDGCEERYSGLTAKWPAAGWLDGMILNAQVLSSTQSSEDENCIVEDQARGLLDLMQSEKVEGVLEEEGKIDIELWEKAEVLEPKW